jgi:hypothetical protein
MEKNANLIAIRLFYIFLFIGISSCAVKPAQRSLNPENSKEYEVSLLLADSIIGWGLDHEALFTIKGHLKPMSSLANLYLPLAGDSTKKDGDAEVIDPNHPDLRRLMEYQRTLTLLENDSLGFFIGPFTMAQGQTRVMQVLVYKKSTIRAMVKRYQAFFGQYGITPETDPKIIIQVVEQAESADRLRGYGYLFGYPLHAVDFFVEAAKHHEETGHFVERDFIQIPVHTREEGYFVYAVPKGYTAVEEDNYLKTTAASILEDYRNRRSQYVVNGRLMAVRLLREW